MRLDVDSLELSGSVLRGCDEVCRQPAELHARAALTQPWEHDLGEPDIARVAQVAEVWAGYKRNTP
jgi:hypothetical protein